MDICHNWVLVCPASAASAQYACAGVVIAVMSALFATTVACIWGSRKNMSFDICSLITLMKPYLDRFRVLLVGLTSEV